MTSIVGWVLVSRQDVAKAEAALASDDIGVRDEVGFLAIHQGFADRFFPGTSVLHTRLRYALFVPWLMERAAESGSDAARRYADLETRLAEQLLEGRRKAQASGGGDHDPLKWSGIIGERTWPKPTAQPPSFSYWTALSTWGLLRPRADGGVPTRRDTFARLSRQTANRRSRWYDDDGSPISNTDEWPFIGLPQPPEGLGVRGQPLDFALTHPERRFLRKQLLGVGKPGSTQPSLMARLVDARIGADIEWPWHDPVRNLADEADQAALAIAKHAAAISAIGRAIYQCLVECARQEDGFSSSAVHRSFLDGALAQHSSDARRLDLDALRHFLPRLPGDLITVLQETQSWLSQPSRDPRSLRDVYAAAETSRKHSRARLPRSHGAKLRREEWDPSEQPASRPLHYRWFNVTRLLSDLQAS